MFSWLFRPVRAAAAAAVPTAKAAPAPPAAEGPVRAVIAGRDCLAYHDIPCTVCHESCPVPGAIVLVERLPRVVPAVCTGCRLCQEVCPAPTNAIRFFPPPPTTAA